MKITKGMKMRVTDKDSPFTGEIVEVVNVVELPDSSGFVFCKSLITDEEEPYLPEELQFV